jgi:signal transduction histidine kinase
LLEDDLPASERNEYVDHLRTSAARLTHIVQEILDITSISTGKISLAEEETDLEKIMADLNAAFTHAAQKKGLTFSVSRSGKVPPSVLADEIRLRQTIVNILENALKFTANGFVRVRFYFRRTGDAGLLTCCVRDSGIGIPEKDLDQIFTPFFQSDSSASRKFEGAGLGLAICKKLAMLMGGNISVVSRPERGSLFMLRIPVGCPDVTCNWLEEKRNPANHPMLIQSKS